MQQAGQQCLVGARLVKSLLLVALQHVLHLHPRCAGNQPRVLPHADDPLADRQVDGGAPLLLIGAVVGQQTVLAVESVRFREQLGLLVGEIPVCLVVGHHIHGILQYRPDGKAGEVLAVLGDDAALHQLGLGESEGVRFKEQAVNGLDDLRLFGD